MKNRGWILWVVLIGYFLAVFILAWKHLALLYGLTCIPLFVIAIVRWIQDRDLVDHLYSNHPEIWGKLARDMHNKIRGNIDFLHYVFSKEETDDPELRMMKKGCKTAVQLQIFAGAVFFAILMRSCVSVSR